MLQNFSQISVDVSDEGSVIHLRPSAGVPSSGGGGNTVGARGGAAGEGDAATSRHASAPPNRSRFAHPPLHGLTHIHTSAYTAALR